MITNMSPNEKEVKLKLLDEDIRDLNIFAEKIESVYLEELWTHSIYLTISTNEEFLNKYTKRMKIVFEELYSDLCFENKTFTSMTRQIELSVITNICKPSLALLEKNLKTAKNNTNNDEFRNFLKHCVNTGHVGLHTCKNKFIKIHNDSNKVSFVYCPHCDVVYFDAFIHMWCDSCQKEYCSFSLIDEKMLQPATWFKYHCRLLINEQMKCQTCETNYYLTGSGKLYCHKCKSEADPMKINWICYNCNETFNTSAKIYNPNEFRAVKLALRDALIQKSLARPKSVSCCKIKISDYVFFHKKDCEGLLYLGMLNGTTIIVCSKCKTLTQIDKHYWSCPNCFTRFKNEEIYSTNNQVSTEPNLPEKGGIYNKPIQTEVSIQVENRRMMRDEASPSDSRRVYSKKRNISIHWHKNFLPDEMKEKKIKELSIGTTSESQNYNKIIEKKIVPTPRNKHLNSNERENNNNSPNIKVLRRKLGDNEQEKANIIKLNISAHRGMSLDKNRAGDISINIPLPKKNSAVFQQADFKIKDRLAILEPIAELNNEGKIYKKSQVKVRPTNHSCERDHRASNKLIEKDFLDVPKSLYANQNKKIAEEEEDDKLTEFNVDDYKVIAMIGEGSFGKIYLVEDKYTNQFSMKKIFANDEVELETFTQEYELVNKTQHPNILKILGICKRKLDTTTQALFILMEVGISDWDKEIKTRQNSKKYYSEKELLDILKQLNEALVYLQQKGISHRDIKPQNILLFKGCVFKLADFGEAKQISLKEVDKELLTMRGTELYMSPLLFNGLRTHQNDVKHNTYKSDVFSLALCMLYATTLNVKAIYEVRFLYDSKAILSTLNKILGGRFSTNYINLLYKMLEVNEKNRYDFMDLQKGLSSFT
jgi:hypothetical protein